MTKIKYPKKINSQKIAETLIFIFRVLSLEGKTDPYSCGLVANKLNRYNPRKERPWTYSYIRNIYKGKQTPSRYIAPAIDKLYQRLSNPPKPPRKRYRTIIEATSKEQWESWQNRTMEEKRKALDNM